MDLANSARVERKPISGWNERVGDKGAIATFAPRDSHYFGEFLCIFGVAIGCVPYEALGQIHG